MWEGREKRAETGGVLEKDERGESKRERGMIKRKKWETVKQHNKREREREGGGAEAVLQTTAANKCNYLLPPA